MVTQKLGKAANPGPTLMVGRAELQPQVCSGRGTWNLFKACLALVETPALSRVMTMNGISQHLSRAWGSLSPCVCLFLGLFGAAWETGSIPR